MFSVLHAYGEFLVRITLEIPVPAIAAKMNPEITVALTLSDNLSFSSAERTWSKLLLIL